MKEECYITMLRIHVINLIFLLWLYYKEGSSEPPQQGAGLNNYIISLTWVYLRLPQLMNTLALFTIFITSKVGISAQLHSKYSPVVE